VAFGVGGLISLLGQCEVFGDLNAQLLDFFSAFDQLGYCNVPAGVAAV
jgi:hypothetical protein